MILNKLFYPFANPEFWGLKADLKFKVMKTTYYLYRLNRIIILISIFLLILSFAVNAQTRSSRNGDKNHNRTRATTVQRSDNTNRNRTGTTTVQRSNNSRNARTSLNYDRRKETTSNQGRLLNVRQNRSSKLIPIRAMIIIIIIKNISIISRRCIISSITIFIANRTIIRSIIIRHPGHITIIQSYFIILILVNSITTAEGFTDMTGDMDISMLTCQRMYTSTRFLMGIAGFI